MFFRILTNRIFKPLFVFFASIGLIVLLIILASNEKGATMINENLKLYYGAIGFFLLLGMASLMIFWRQYRDWREESELIDKYRKKDKPNK